jgi:hypothetical protein
MRLQLSQKTSHYFATLVLGCLLLCQLPSASAQSLSATLLDDLFLLDSPPSPIQQPIEPTAFSKNEPVAYLASTVSSSSMPIAKEWGSPTGTSANTTVNNGMVSTQELLKITRSPQLLLALQRMSYVPMARASLEALQQRGGKVMFKNLAELGAEYATFDALAWLSKDPAMEGAWVLFIAEKHRKAPIEALASLITHEALHADFQNSLCEEEHAWLAEVTAWKQFKAQNPTLQHIPKGWFALVDRLNTIEVAQVQQTLKMMIRTNPGYAGLQEGSPYFRYSPFTPQMETVGQNRARQSAFNAQPKREMTTPFDFPIKSLPVAANGRPKLMLRPLRTW